MRFIATTIHSFRRKLGAKPKLLTLKSIDGAGPHVDWLKTTTMLGMGRWRRVRSVRYPLFVNTVLLLICSNVFMTFAWYGHLKYGHAWPLWKAILVSWSIALLEYCLAVPANRLGYGEFTGFQLKIIQEVVTLVVFMVFALTFLKEKFAWNYLVAFALLGAAAFFAFAFKAPGPAA